MDSIFDHDTPTANPRHLNADSFWPSIDLARLRQDLQLDARISDARLEIAALGAITKVNRELAYWRMKLRRQGYGTLASVPLGETPDLADGYLHAVQAATALELHRHLRHVHCGTALPLQPGHLKQTLAQTYGDDEHD